jgi:glycerol uptake facilitator-like aquaporin
MNYRALIAEFVGTFALIFVGVGSVAVISGPVMGALAAAFYPPGLEEPTQAPRPTR